MIAPNWSLSFGAIRKIKRHLKEDGLPPHGSRHYGKFCVHFGNIWKITDHHTLGSTELCIPGQLPNSQPPHGVRACAACLLPMDNRPHPSWPSLGQSASFLSSLALILEGDASRATRGRSFRLAESKRNKIKLTSRQKQMEGSKRESRLCWGPSLGCFQPNSCPFGIWEPTHSFFC